MYKLLYLYVASEKAKTYALSISIALPYKNVEFNTVKFLTVHLFPAIEILKTADVSVIEPVLMLLLTVKFSVQMFNAEPIV